MQSGESEPIFEVDETASQHRIEVEICASRINYGDWKIEHEMGWSGDLCFWKSRPDVRPLKYTSQYWRAIFYMFLMFRCRVGLVGLHSSVVVFQLTMLRFHEITVYTGYGEQQRGHAKFQHQWPSRGPCKVRTVECAMLRFCWLQTKTLFQSLQLVFNTCLQCMSIYSYQYPKWLAKRIAVQNILVLPQKPLLLQSPRTFNIQHMLPELWHCTM